jgi:16S rRNA (guanine527-N7)-methyltransferase
MPSPIDASQIDPTLVAVLERSREIGFLGNGPVDGHILHALRFAEVLEGDAPHRVVDLGSGGGLPGLVLASIWPSTAFLLLDALRKRCDFLENAVARLGMEDRVTVLCERAELAGRWPDLRHEFSLVTARSFGPPAVVAECGAPFLAVGGHLVVSEPPDTSGRWPAEGLALLGLEVRPPAPASQAAGTSAPNMQVLEQVALVEERYPRRVGIPTKRPLF